MHVIPKGTKGNVRGPGRRLSLLIGAVIIIALLFMPSSPTVEPYDPELAATLKNLRGAVPPPGMQMGLKQIERIRKAIPEGGNILIFGFGNDSPYWDASTTGRVTFLEVRSSKLLSDQLLKRILGALPSSAKYFICLIDAANFANAKVISNVVNTASHASRHIAGRSREL